MGLHGHGNEATHAFMNRRESGIVVTVPNCTPIMKAEVSTSHRARRRYCAFHVECTLRPIQDVLHLKAWRPPCVGLQSAGPYTAGGGIPDSGTIGLRGTREVTRTPGQ